MKQNVALLAVAAVLLLLVHQFDGADAFLPAFKRGSPVNRFCKTADSKRLCTRMVQGASNQHDASANAIRATATLAKKIQSMSGAVVSATKGLPKVSRDSIVQTCKESFDDAVDDLSQSLTALDANDQGTVMIHLSAALPSDCGDALSEFGKSFPLQRIYNLYQRYLDNTLAVVSQQ